MKNNKFNKEDLINLLIKKASGFYYSEEQYEYEKTQNKNNLNKISSKNISFFENYDRGENVLNQSNDKINLSNEKQLSDEKNENLTLIKKKITTHYVSPDINAIKILFEIFENKVGENSIESLSDNELLNLKNQLVEELIYETKQN